MFLFLCFCLYVSVSTFLSLSVSITVSTLLSLSVCMSASVFLSLFVCISFDLLCLCLSMWQCVYLSVTVVHLSVPPSVSLLQYLLVLTLLICPCPPYKVDRDKRQWPETGGVPLVLRSHSQDLLLFVLPPPPPPPPRRGGGGGCKCHVLRKWSAGSPDQRGCQPSQPSYPPNQSSTFPYPHLFKMYPRRALLRRMRVGFLKQDTLIKNT